MLTPRMEQHAQDVHLPRETQCPLHMIKYIDNHHLQITFHVNARIA